MEESKISKFMKLYGNGNDFLKVTAEGKSGFVCRLYVKFHETFIGHTFTVRSVDFRRKGEELPYHNDFISKNEYPEIEVSPEVFNRLFEVFEVYEVGNEVITMMKLPDYFEKVFRDKEFEITYKWL